MSIERKSFNELDWDAATFRAWLRAMDVSQHEAARRLGLHHKTINKYATGNLKVTRVVTLASRHLLLMRQAEMNSAKERTNKLIEKVAERVTEEE